MWFVRPVQQFRLPGTGLEFVHVRVPLTVVGSRRRPVTGYFRFDTGCQITTVSEDVAAGFGLPAGGPRINVGGSTGTGPGRLVPVRFRFPTSPSGPGLVVNSTWIVTSGRAGVALLGFQEVHRHFQVRTEQFEMWFVPWPKPVGTSPP